MCGVGDDLLGSALSQREYANYKGDIYIGGTATVNIDINVPMQARCLFAHKHNVKIGRGGNEPALQRLQ